MKFKYMIFPLVLLITLYTGGCEKKSASDPPVDDGDQSGLYGSGTLYFESTSLDHNFDVTGDYKPSNLFSLDSASSGAGGFAQDTALFGKKINALIAAYEHSIDGPVLNERLILIAIRDSASKIRTGNYQVSYQNKTTTSSAAYIYFLLSDSVNFYQMFIPKTGVLTINSYDENTRKIRGTFRATLYSNPPDTLREISITNGSFNIFLKDEYFNY